MGGRVDGLVTLVTGGSSGIGRATALLLGREGAQVVVADLQEDRGQEVVDEICGEGGEAVFVRCDVTSASDVDALVTGVVETHGRLDGALNNAGIRAEAVTLEVTNRGDRPVQVGSHYPFFETNRALVFDRSKAYGRRLDIPAGTAVRFEPGEKKTVSLVAIAGARVVQGGNALGSGPVSPENQERALAEVAARGFGHEEGA